MFWWLQTTYRELFQSPQRNWLFTSFTGSIWPVAWRWTADGKGQTGLGSLSGTVMGISCVTTETVLVLLAEAGLCWHTVPFHHFHLGYFSTLSLPPCWALSSLQPTHLSDVSLTSPNRNVCSQETQAQPATPFRTGEDVWWTHNFRGLSPWRTCQVMRTEGLFFTFIM